MENMNYYEPGIEVPEEKEEQPVAEAIKKPRFYTPWEVGDTEYKLKLTSGAITTLEGKFKDSLLNVVLDNGVPTVSIVLTILQAALQKFHHGIKTEAVGDLYDQYIDDGHTQMDLLSDVLLPLMGDAGFFTAKQLQMMQEEMKTLDQEL